MSTIDIKTVVASIKVHFARGLEDEDLTSRIRADFPGVSSDQYTQAADIAWIEIKAKGELQIRCVERKYSVWFISGGYEECEWQGDTHWEAALEAHAVTHSKRSDYRGLPVRDLVDVR